MSGRRAARAARALALAALGFAAPGCGSIAVQVGYWNDDPRGPALETPIYIFGGTINDVVAVVGAAQADNEASIGVLLIFDVPFSIAVDVILLPLCIWQQIERAYSGPPVTSPPSSSP